MSTDNVLYITKLGFSPTIFCQQKKALKFSAQETHPFDIPLMQIWLIYIQRERFLKPESAF
jgi:hypothetical protein